jgi:hypothetical protein
MIVSRATFHAIAAAEYARVHGPGHSADWVLGYQAAAKAIMEAISDDGVEARERRG